MKKEQFFMFMRGYDESQGGFVMGEGKYSYGCHFEQAEGYIHECANGVKVAISKARKYGGWHATEITTGYSLGHTFDKIADVIEHAEKVAEVTTKMLTEQRTKIIIDNLNKYKEKLKTPA